MNLKNLFKKAKKQSEEYSVYMATDLSKYKINEYILFSDEGVFNHGFKLKTLVDEFNKTHPNKTPFVVKVPPKRFTVM